MKTEKYIVTLVIEQWNKYYNLFGFFTGGEWKKYQYEQQIVFNSYAGLKDRMKDWHKANEIARRKDQKRIPAYAFRYKIYKIEVVQVMDELEQENIDDMIYG